MCFPVTIRKGITIGRRKNDKIKTKEYDNIMAIEPKTTREHIVSLYGHIKGVKKDIVHMHKGIHELGGKIDKIYWVLLGTVGAVSLVLIEWLISIV